MGFKTWHFIKGHILLCPLFLVLTACVTDMTIPRHEYNLAKTAKINAKESDSARHAPNLYHKANRYYKRAVKRFEERRFDEATKLFKKSRYYSERAENVARVKQFKQGDMSP